eukprot:TRINITY_DN136020_c1_g1_i1.p2 TRINITY_DN136020_c1_g1~~TRINITY_DN136020_c1_g1_i1.p2  ORF type:complete len:257 (+),score=-5.02 TRINITY_DN136020_c1_g1_i1:146-916(+)
MAENILKCSFDDKTNVLKIYSTKKSIEMKPGKPKKRRLTEGGHFAGRWTKDEHLRFIKGDLLFIILEQPYKNTGSNGTPLKLRFPVVPWYKLGLTPRSFSSKCPKQLLQTQTWLNSSKATPWLILSVSPKTTSMKVMKSLKKFPTMTLLWSTNLIILLPKKATLQGMGQQNSMSLLPSQFKPKTRKGKKREVSQTFPRRPTKMAMTTIIQSQILRPRIKKLFLWPLLLLWLRLHSSQLRCYQWKVPQGRPKRASNI